MSLVTRLLGLASREMGGGPPIAESELAVAALLLEVARVDGAVGRRERGVVVRLLQARFGLSDRAVERWLRRADILDREVADVASLVEMLGHSVDDGERRRLLDMAYQVADADGAIVEVEEDLVWRLGHLMGLSDADLAAIRREAVRPAGA